MWLAASPFVKTKRRQEGTPAAQEQSGGDQCTADKEATQLMVRLAVDQGPSFFELGFRAESVTYINKYKYRLNK